MSSDDIKGKVKVFSKEKRLLRLYEFLNQHLIYTVLMRSGMSDVLIVETAAQDVVTAVGAVDLVRSCNSTSCCGRHPRRSRSTDISHPGTKIVQRTEAQIPSISHSNNSSASENNTVLRKKKKKKNKTKSTSNSFTSYNSRLFTCKI
ncbi:hypothetical protein J6590_010586 [Homalodisca vitripennis]|nr:hypothetical protein J6590_010586 [Homalodisca vitripennis]